MAHKLRLVIGALVVGLGLFVTACGSDNSSSSSLPTATGNQPSGNATAPGGFGNNPSTLPTQNSVNIPAQPAQPGGLFGSAQAATDPNGLQGAIIRVVQQTRPAVVIITVTISSGGGGGIFGGGQAQQGTAVGSGSIIDAQGHIITNNHVVESATGAVRVGLPDGRKFTARIVGRDPRNDFAVIQIDNPPSNLPIMKLGDSSKVALGEWVVAIGNALGLEGGPTVSQGIIGALNRSVAESDTVQLTGMIQTDAPINPGNSGGALLNLNGEQVGINTAVARAPEELGGQAAGIGFAIPINRAKQLAQQMIGGNSGGTNTGGTNNGGVLQRPYIGISTSDMNAATASRYNLPVDTGILVTKVADNSPAAQAGIKAGAVIVGINGTQIQSSADLQGFLDTAQAGQQITLNLIPYGEQNPRNVQITLGAKQG